MTRDLPEQRPEGKLIQDALKASGRSIRQVAPLADISEARWRQLVQGWMPTGPKETKAQKAPAATLARMAQAAGVTAQQLTDAGRQDAAEILERMPTGPQPATVRGKVHMPAVRVVATASSASTVNDEIEMIYQSKTMTAQQKLDAIRMVLQLRAQVEAEAIEAARDDVTEEGQEPANNGAH